MSLIGNAHPSNPFPEGETYLCRFLRADALKKRHFIQFPAPGGGVGVGGKPSLDKPGLRNRAWERSREMSDYTLWQYIINSLHAKQVLS